MVRLLLVLACALVLSACAKTPMMSDDLMGSDGLDGTSWLLASVETGGTTLSRQPDTTPMLSFEEGRVTGSDGCNRLNGSVRTMDGGLVFGPLAMTRMACAPEVAAVADPVGEALSDQEVKTEMMLDGMEMKMMSNGTTLVFIRTGPEGMGPDTYDASAELQCSAGNDGLGGVCGVRILRDTAAGTAELWISNPAYVDMARYRVLTFADGGFSAWDGAEVSATQRGDHWAETTGRRPLDCRSERGILPYP